MKYAILTLSVLMAGQAVAGEVSVSVDNFNRHGRSAYAVFKVKNDLGKPVKNIQIDCAFLDKDKKAIDVGYASVENIGSNEYAYDKASIVTDRDIQYIECRVAKFD